MHTQAPRYFTKSRFQQALSCPTKLDYSGKPAYTNTQNDDPFMAMLADGGFQVGALAKLKYPGGIEVWSADTTTALRETAALLRQENVVLFEAAIAKDAFLVRVDVLVKRGQLIELIEVKAKSYSGDPASLTGKNGDISGDMRPYLQDLAFQKHVVQLAFPHCTVVAYLLMPDKSKTCAENGVNQWFKVQRESGITHVQVDPRAALPDLAGLAGLADSLLTCVPVDHSVNHILQHPLAAPGSQGTLAQLADLWAKHYQRDERVAPVIGAHCASCEYQAAPDSQTTLTSGFHQCWKEANHWTDADFATGTVLNIWNFRGKDKLIRKGTLKLHQVTPDDIKLSESDCEDLETKGHGPLSNAQRQWLQIKGLPRHCADAGFYLDRDGLASTMQSWIYPLHMIDFETASVALPFHAGRRPYEQVAFQFSHHLVAQDGTVRHAHQFLNAEPGQFPNYAFVRALHQALGHDSGTILRWSHHENSILTAIKTQLQNDPARPDDAEDLIAFIATITTGGPRTMVDLADIARKHYFHPSTQGSSSIKKVLPAVMQSAAYLKARYSHPQYGSPSGTPSLNFGPTAWWQPDANGIAIDPYKLLLNPLHSASINQGGAASYAYLRLQFEALEDGERAALQAALLRYCELDTLAMVMILQGWVNG